MKYFLAVLTFVATMCSGCGATDTSVERRTNRPSAEQQILELQGQLNSLLNSDFKTCTGLGETADPLIKRICQIAQANNNETRVELMGIISQGLKDLESKMSATNVDINALYASISGINTSLATLTALVSAGMFDAEIGTELLSAGPIREVVLVKQDRSRVNGYVDSKTTSLTLGNNPVGTSNGSPTLTITKPTTTITVTIASPAVVSWAANPWANGDTVMFSTTGALPTGLTVNTVYYVKNRTASTFELATTPSGTSINTTGGQSGTHSGSLGVATGDVVNIVDIATGNGISRGQLNGDFQVSAAVTASFTVIVNVNATSGGFFGSNLGQIKRVNGQGMSTVWQVADGSDAAVRTTSVSTRPYNFIVKLSAGSGYVCYDTTSAAATFATINAATTFPGLTGNIRCK